MTEKEAVQKALDKVREATKEDASAIAWMRTNFDVMKLVMAWGKIQHTFEGGHGTKVPRKDYNRWVWLWRNYKYDLREWLHVAGVVNQEYGGRLVDRLIKLRLVLPDGTYPQIIQEFLTVAAFAKETPGKKDK
jgi:hypothetical protein